MSMVFYDFMEQLNNLLNDVTIFGNMLNFVGTVDPADPFNNKPPPVVVLLMRCMMGNGTKIL